MITPGSSAFDNSSVDWSTLASVADFSLLPDVLEYAGVSYLVLNATGTWLLGIKKKAGLYRSTGSEWLYMGSNVVIDDSSPSTEKAFSSQKISDQLLLKVSKEVGKALSANDYTDTEKAKLLGIEDSAQANTVDSVAGKTGAVTLTKGDVALPNVDNVSDVNKPISTAQQNALDSKIDDNQVLTNVPLGAVFTDTVYSKPTSEPIGYIANLQAALNLKANQATTYNKTEVDDKDAVLAAETALRNFVPSVDPIISLNFAKNKSSIYGGFEVGQVEKTIFQTAIDGDLTVVNGEATGFDPRGRLIYSTANKPRLVFDADTGVSQGLLVEEARTNFLNYTDMAEPASKYNGAVSYPMLTTLPDGGYGIVQRATYDASTGRQAIRFGNLSLGVALTPYTGSAYLRLVSGAVDAMSIQVNDSRANITISNEWQRFSLTAATDNAYRFLDVELEAAQSETVVDICFVQLEQGSFPTSYIPSTETFTSRASTATYIDSTGTLQTAAIDTARISYNPADLSAPGKLLLEGASTNLFLYTKNMTIANSDLQAGDISDSAGDSNFSYFDSGIAFNTPTVTTYYYKKYTFTSIQATFSMYIVMDDGSKPVVGAVNDSAADFALTVDGGIINGALVQKQNLGNGRWRVSYYMVDTSYYNGYFGVQTRTGNSGKNYTVYGMQLEESPYPTSYIPTTTAQVTRSADVSTSAQTTRVGDSVSRVLGDEFNKDEFSLYIEQNMKFNKGRSVFSVGIGVSSTDYVGLYNTTSGQAISFYTRNGSNTESMLTGAGVPYGDEVKFIFTYKSDGTITTTVNGVHATGTTTNTMDLIDKILTLGGRFAGDVTECGIKNAQIYPKALPEAECIALTS
jgi:hypothetical protein